MDDVWSKLQHFTRNENWGDPDRMDPDFLFQLDNFRHTVGHSFVLTTAAFARSGHVSDSYHYKGRAADGRFVQGESKEPLSLVDHVLIALRSPFGGVGIYTWSPHGPFLHFDNRLASYGRKIWVSEKEGEYQNLSADLLRKLLTP